MWSFAIAMTHHCGRSTVTVFLAEIFEQPENTLREDGWWVIVTTDRGLYAPWLYEAIKQRRLASIHAY
jgi:hypothetical protein